MSRKFGLLPCPPCPFHMNSILSGFTTRKTKCKASVVLNDSLGKALGNGVSDKGSGSRSERRERSQEEILLNSFSLI